ncbi:MAG: hypothetical protein ACM3X6_05025 [Patescibacteria group bacterium]
MSPDKPVPFGYKIGWWAVPACEPKRIIDALGLLDPVEATWEKGILAVYERGQENLIYITPAVDGWRMIVGYCASGELAGVKDLTVKLSTEFGEAQCFATHRVVSYDHWMLARAGRMIRCFAYLGESLEVLCDEGEKTAIEQGFNWDGLVDVDWIPDEAEVMTVAGSWSIDPTKLSGETVCTGKGFLARAPEELFERIWRKIAEIAPMGKSRKPFLHHICQFIKDIPKALFCLVFLPFVVLYLLFWVLTATFMIIRTRLMAQMGDKERALALMGRFLLAWPGKQRRFHKWLYHRLVRPSETWSTRKSNQDRGEFSPRLRDRI